MMFSVLEWLYPKLSVISGLTWVPSWPQNFTSLPRACFRLADDSTGKVVEGGDGSSLVSVYLDVWSATPEARETADKAIKQTMTVLGMNRGMTRHSEEVSPNEKMMFRSTTLWRGEWDHGTARMCRP